MAATAASFEVSTDSGSLDAWLQRLSGDSCAQFAALRDQAQKLSSSALPATQRFGLLERMRAHALASMPELRSRYLCKPVPLDGDERDAWKAAVGLWEALYVSYALCSESGVAPEAAAAVWQRALDCLGRAIREHAYAYHAVPGGLWKELNSCYRTVEDCSLAEIAVADESPAGGESSCKRTYIATLLHDAGNLYALDAPQMAALEQLLAGWAALIELMTVHPADVARSPLAVDLAGETGAQLARSLQPAETLRYVETGLLAPRLREIGAAVRGGTLPLELAATRSLGRQATERLLTHLYVQWCSAGTGRLEERRATTRRAQVALNMHAIHFQISGRAFRQPGLRYTREEEHDLATFGHITERTEQRLLTSRSSALEPWEVLNQSASGSLSMSRKADLDSRIHHGQLVAMRTSSMEPPQLGVVQRLRIEADGQLGIGVRIIRGEIRGAAVRAFGDASLKYERALIVEADKERGTAAYLILPQGRYAVGSTLDLHAGRAEKVVVSGVLEQYVDHDCVSYQLA